MRVVFANRASHVIGGAEQYLQEAARGLVAAGHEVAFWFQGRPVLENKPLELPPGAPTWFGRDGKEGFGAAQAWRPDVAYCNGLDSATLERQFAALAPSIYSAHAYFGTCISGFKMHARPVPTPCARTFGPACLALYLPRRCGGLSPLTMITRYRIEYERLDAIRRYRRVVVHSQHMREEYAHHGIAATLVSLPVERTTVAEASRSPGDELRLLFIGRMNETKGGRTLIDALVPIASAVGRTVELVLAGDGEDRPAWEQQAAGVARGHGRVRVRFVGWADRATRDGLLARADLLMVPSAWPEPFGMVGLEAAAYGVPAVAFDVGGISEWLEDGVNGCLAGSDPSDRAAFASAVSRAVRSRQELQAGARETHRRFANHSLANELLEVFKTVS